MNMKVQIIGTLTGASFIGGGNPENPLTFHAFSPVMKARVMELYLDPRNEGLIAISNTDEAPRTGEWHEPVTGNAIVNNTLNTIVTCEYVNGIAE
jgi:hypothetical protein